ncbi:hypothetical protein [Neorhizobium sp. LjRoot104]|uniref:hypothetical protein n=1 Tax=Neorhizobium sp. LjRoot104 TaxID=3342254 RepID=UPI003ECF3164
MFAADAVLGFTLTKTLFNDTMRVINETRIELFHSNPIKDRKKIVEAELIQKSKQEHASSSYD